MPESRRLDLAGFRAQLGQCRLGLCRGFARFERRMDALDGRGRGNGQAHDPLALLGGGEMLVGMRETGHAGSLSGRQWVNPNRAGRWDVQGAG